MPYFLVTKKEATAVAKELEELEFSRRKIGKKIAESLGAVSFITSHGDFLGVYFEDNKNPLPLRLAPIKSYPGSFRLKLTKENKAILGEVNSEEYKKLFKSKSAELQRILNFNSIVSDDRLLLNIQIYSRVCADKKKRWFTFVNDRFVSKLNFPRGITEITHADYKKHVGNKIFLVDSKQF